MLYKVDRCQFLFCFEPAESRSDFSYVYFLGRRSSFSISKNKNFCELIICHVHNYLSIIVLFLLPCAVLAVDVGFEATHRYNKMLWEMGIAECRGEARGNWPARTLEREREN